MLFSKTQNLIWHSHNNYLAHNQLHIVCTYMYDSGLSLPSVQAEEPAPKPKKRRKRKKKGEQASEALQPDLTLPIPTLGLSQWLAVNEPLAFRYLCNHLNCYAALWLFLTLVLCLGQQTFNYNLILATNAASSNL